ncbi:hypothetical protein [Stenotrophomonas sp. NPDC077659]|uniref:hypothetical protein n=1 Tax=Stenotrophomonas sp. NPDC077659 TaxID=3390694 RepID=UPI003D047F9D
MNCRLQDPAALPLALTVGAATGALVAALASVFTPTASLLDGSAFGMGLAAFAVGGRVDNEQLTREHRERWDYLNQHPEMRRVIQQRGLTFDDVVAVGVQHAIVTRRVAEAMDALQTVCRAHGLLLSTQMERALGVFYITHCADSALLLIAGLQHQGIYLAAVDDAIKPEVDALLAAGRLPGPVLRNSGAAFMRLDEVNRLLQDGADFDVRCLDREWRVEVRSSPQRADEAAAEVLHAAAADTGPTPAGTFETGEVVQVRRRHQATARPAREGAPLPTPAAPAAPSGVTVRWGTTLLEQLAGMARNGVTHRDLRKISEDLAHGRVNGHPVIVNGHRYTASDINIEGASGRGRWRLLHRRDGAGHELVGIVDYHGQRSQWWTG